MRAGFNQAYTAALRIGKQLALSEAEGGNYISVLERAKYVAEDYLAHFSPERRQAILLGALTSVYSKEQPGSDTAVWLAGSKDEANESRPGMGQSSIAHEMIVTLREIGLLNDIITTKEGRVVYPIELDQPGQAD